MALSHDWGCAPLSAVPLSPKEVVIFLKLVLDALQILGSWPGRVFLHSDIGDREILLG